LEERCPGLSTKGCSRWKAGKGGGWGRAAPQTVFAWGNPEKKKGKQLRSDRVFKKEGEASIIRVPEKKGTKGDT